jgi:phospholipid transport system substrate-binding protein
MKSFFCMLFGATLFFTGGFAANAAAAQTPGPEALAKQVTNDVLSAVRSDAALRHGNKQKLLELVESKVLPHFDFHRMTQLAMGRNWRKANADQQQTLVKQFRDLLVNTYTNAFTQYRDQTVSYMPVRMQPGDTDVTVRSRINQPGGQAIPVEYAMEKLSDGWKVYDVTIEGISLVQTYRGTFDQEVQRGGVDGLIKAITAKNQALRAARQQGQ